jgi:hypothetical protein
MLLAELKIKIRGEYEDWEKNEVKIEEAFFKLQSYAEQLFMDDWAEKLELELDE